MAGANLPAKKYKKTSPTVSRLSFEFDGGSTQFIDIAMALSAINRKFYRQGVYYYVNSVEIYNDETGVVDLHTVPDNWVTKNAWNRGFTLFQKMNALAGSPLTSGQRGAYHDFKVYMNATHMNAGSTPPNLYTINGGPAAAQAYSPDDWDYSQFVSADDDQDNTANADEFYVHMLGTHYSLANTSSDDWESVGLIKSYAESRATVQDDSPEVTQSAIIDPLINVFDFSSEEQMNDIVENLQNTNDSPPYDRDAYIGELSKSMQHVARIGTEQGVGRIGRASGFCAPFGLICVDPHGVSTAFRVVLNLAQGTYHGIYAERA